MDAVFFHPTLAQVAIGTLVVCVAAGYALLQYHKQKYPPGPASLQTVIALVFEPNQLLEFKEKCKLQFDQIYTMFIGFSPSIVLSGFEAIEEAFVTNAANCSSRPRGMERLFTGTKDKGILFSPYWKEQRKFALNVLKEQGMGKIDMESSILDEAKLFLREIEKHENAPLDLESYIHKATSNIMGRMILGKRFDYSDPTLTSILNKLQNHTRLIQSMRIVERLPCLLNLPGDIFGYHKFLQNAKTNCGFLMEEIRCHARTLDPLCPRDFVDAFLIEMGKQSGTSSTDAVFDESSCMATSVQLFVAGTDTTASTLLWAWLFMILYPEIQKRVQIEIDEQIGSRNPSMGDRVHMPFTEAVLTEVMRLGNAAINSLPHITDVDVTVSNHVIPKDTVMTASVSDVHLDGNTYTDPLTFNPDRFIDHDGNFLKPRKFIPFGLGRRVCPGESLARAELFLFFTSTLQLFELRASKGSQPSAKGRISFTHKPQPYKVTFAKRACQQGLD